MEEVGLHLVQLCLLCPQTKGSNDEIDISLQFLHSHTASLVAVAKPFIQSEIDLILMTSCVGLKRSMYCMDLNSLGVPTSSQDASSLAERTRLLDTAIASLILDSEGGKRQRIGFGPIPSVSSKCPATEALEAALSHTDELFASSGLDLLNASATSYVHPKVSPQEKASQNVPEGTTSFNVMTACVEAVRRVT